MTKQYLISFCNNKKNIHAQTNLIAQLEVDLNAQKASLIDLPLIMPSDLKGNGVTGMCFHKGQLVLLLQRMPSTLVFFDDDFKFSHYFELTGLKGVHSILSRGGFIYLSVTNQDRIVKVNDENQQFDVWSNETLEDTIHLNSICIHNNELYASAFGKKANELWSSAQSGYVFRVLDGKKVIDNIWHPHSSFSYDNQIFCCNSSKQQIISEEGVYQADYPGYTRGLYIDDDLLICGASLGRLVSHSTGLRISNKSDQGVLAGECGITVNFKNSQVTQFLSLSQCATEIFDVLPIRD